MPCSAPCAAPSPDPGAQDPGPPAGQANERLFATNSFWNSSVADNAPLAADSSGLVGELNRLVSTDQTLGRGPWINTNEWSTPIYRVPADQPTVHVTLDQFNPALQAAIAAVPLPPDARPAAGTDEQLVVWQAATNRMWEFWQLRRAADGWHAMWGGEMDDVSDNPGRYANDWGATASSLPLAGGLMTIDELRAGVIDHALAIGIPEVRAGWFAWPANRTDGRIADPLAIPEGTRFRLDPRLDVEALAVPRFTKILARAAQRYGLVVRDTSGNVTLYAEDPTPTGSNPYPAFFGGLAPNQILAAFPWSRLQALSASLTPQSD